jgi:hypothetical protein
VLASIFPLSRVNILVYVGHNSFSIALSFRPVTVVDTYTCVYHLADAVFKIIPPLAFVDILRDGSIFKRL